MRASKPLLHARGRLVTLTPCMMREICGRIHAASRRATDIFSGHKDHSSFCHTASSRARTPAAANIAALTAASITSLVGILISAAIPSGINAAEEAVAGVAGVAAVAVTATVAGAGAAEAEEVGVAEVEEAAAVVAAEEAAAVVAAKAEEGGTAAAAGLVGAEEEEVPPVLASFACRSQKSTHLSVVKTVAVAEAAAAEAAEAAAAA